MEITIKIQGLEAIAGAIYNLAESLKLNNVQAPAQQMVQPVQRVTSSQPVQQQAAPQQIQQPQHASVSQQQPVNTYPQTQQPVQAPPTTNQQPVQTSSISYTLDNLSAAAMTLLDAGRQPDLLNLLAQFGVESLPALPAEQYGAFATALRGLGAQI